MAIEKPSRVETGIQNSATAIAKGQVVIMNSVTDGQQCVLSGANAAKVYGVALEASPGQGKPFTVVTMGPVKAKAGGTVTQDQWVESDASGNVVNTTAGAGRNTVGRARESGVSGDFVTIDVFALRFTTS